MILKPLIYKNIKPNLYMIDEAGNVYSLVRNRFLTPTKDKDGYLTISLQILDSNRYSFRIATLVLSVFEGDASKNMVDPTVNHIDGNIKNNHFTNLEWMERKTNSASRFNKPKGELNGSVILTETQVLKICDLISQGKQLTDIATIYGVHKSTIANIKRKKSWAYLTKNFNFDIKKVKSKEQILQQREYIINMFKKEIEPKDIVKLGYSTSVVYRLYKEFKNIKIKI